MTIDSSEAFAVERRAMVESQLRRRDILDPRVLEVMARVPRHEFVPAELRGQAYEDHPIPIGESQTISQPYIVAFMLQALQIAPTDVVLEIGTGSGYLTAILAELSRWTYSIERHPVLAQAAELKLASLGCSNITAMIGDGSQGVPEYAPFDSIVVSAAAPQIPQPLVEQLREGGRMVIPVGPASAQELLLVRKQDDIPVTMRLEGCRFVPLIGVQGYGSGW
jgi:protein-L-isoaspartate(D-aspartate) O-methyltransferase